MFSKFIIVIIHHRHKPFDSDALSIPFFEAVSPHCDDGLTLKHTDSFQICRGPILHFTTK
jgi:hypothetical protein